MKKRYTTALALTLTTVLGQPAFADDYDTVCGNMTPNSQKAEYCMAASQAKSAGKTDKILMALYAASSAVCIADCATNVVTAGVGDFVCESSAIAVGAVDMLKTKNFMSLFSVAIGGLGLVENYPSFKAGFALMTNSVHGEELAETSKLADKSATTHGVRTCWITAGMSAVQAAMHGMSASNDSKTYSSNLANARAVNSSTGGVSYSMSGTSVAASTAASTGAGAASTAMRSAGTGGSSGAGGACGDTSSASGAISCAATADSKMAELASTPQFQSAFQKASGMSLGDYLSKADSMSPASAMQAAGGSVLPDNISSNIDRTMAALQHAAPNFNSEVGSAYASGGGGAKASSGDDEFGKMMSGLMGSLKPKTEEEKRTGVSQVKFGAPQRNLASVTAEDPTVSLFDRVAYRYSNVVPRWLSDAQNKDLKTWNSTATKQN